MHRKKRAAASSRIKETIGAASNQGAMKAWYGILFVAAALGCVGGLYVVWRRWVVLTWRRAASLLECEYRGSRALTPGEIAGNFRRRSMKIAPGVSYEDGPGYHHTAASVTCENPGSVALVLRRKSLMEQFTTRREASAAPTGDQEFDSLFLVTANAPADVVLPPKVRDWVRRLDDLEVFVHPEGVLVRRAGERRQARELVEMAEVGTEIADVLQSMPERSRSLLEQMQDEELLKQGV